MFAQNWEASRREHGVTAQFDVLVTMSDGVRVAAQIFRPTTPGRFPAILGVHAYDAEMQFAPSRPQAVQGKNAQAEAGDPQFFVRRGYAHIMVNARGTGLSEGEYGHYSPREVQDVVEVIAWISEQDWCDGNVGMFGVSYFAVCAKQVAAQNPPALKAVFAPYGYTDFYRDKFYHGGILAHSFLTNWSRHLAGVRVKGWSRDALGKEEYERRLAMLRADRDILAVPELAGAIAAPDKGANSLIVDVLMNPQDGPYWQQRNPILEDIKVPILIGSSWDMYFLHLPGEFRAWERITAPKKMIVGPPVYLDRPVYQYAFESLRWFDHWLKGNDTGLMNEPDVRLFVAGGDGSWKTAESWPLPETVWHPFYLHGQGLLSEHEHWPNEGGSSFEDNSYNARGGVGFASPPMVERTEVIGPLTATIYASTTQPELLLFASLWDIDPSGNQRLLTRGWLKGSMRKVDAKRSRPWLWQYDFTEPEPVSTDGPQRFDINLVPTANVFQKGHRIGLRISSSDQDPVDSLFDMLGQGHLLQQRSSWVTIFHDADHPSVLHVPVTSGNVIGTFMSGGGGAMRKVEGSKAPQANSNSWDNW